MVKVNQKYKNFKNHGDVREKNKACTTRQNKKPVGSK